MSSIPKTYAPVTVPANTLTDIVVMGATKYLTSGALIICNQNNFSVTVRVSIAPGGVSDNRNQYIIYEETWLARESKPFGGGICLGPTDKIRAYASSTFVSFVLSGLEFTITP